MFDWVRGGETHKRKSGVFTEGEEERILHPYQRQILFFFLSVCDKPWTTLETSFSGLFTIVRPSRLQEGASFWPSAY